MCLLQGLGLALSVGGALAQGRAASRAYEEQARAIAEQRDTEARLTAVEADRTRLKFRSAIRRQSAELVARGVTLDSPTAVLLGQTAAQEASFATQEVRSRGEARQRELSAEERIARSRATSALLEGRTTAAGKFLAGAPDIWPELLA